MQKLISLLLALICVILSLLWYLESQNLKQVQSELADLEHRMGLLQISLHQYKTPETAVRQEAPPFQSLGLDDEQRTRVQDVLAGIDNELKPLSDEAQKQAAEFRAMVSEGNKDAVIPAQEKMIAALRELAEKRKALLDERLKGVLTEEQYQKFREGQG